MKINVKQPKYVLPVILLPFFCLFFYTWRSSFAKPKTTAKEIEGLNGSVGNVSTVIRKKQLTDKLDAYRNTYKEASGPTAVNAIPGERSSDPSYHNDYTDLQKQKLDSISLALKVRQASAPHYRSPGNTAGDSQLAQAVNAMTRQVHDQRPPSVKQVHEKDPMDIFKQQMAVMDSINKQHDPAYQEELKKKIFAQQTAKLKEAQPVLSVGKAPVSSDAFNTVSPAKPPALISAVIDESITGYAGSRLRLKLLEDIYAGKTLISKGTYVFAQINGFSGQRVSLAISSILVDGKILPVKLQVYDMDGLPGLYVPASAFRDFSKDLGGNAVQGVTLDGGTGNNQFIMSSLSKVFQSTSSAIADLIRKNKAKLKYHSYLYLIDTDALQSAQKSY